MVFGDHFFDGNLQIQPRVEIEWADAVQEGCYGYTLSKSRCEYHCRFHKASIKVDPNPYPEHKSTISAEERRICVLSTLLHELCHAFLEFCGSEAYTTGADYIRYYGLNGHGESFRHLLMTVSPVARAKFLFGYIFEHRRDQMREMAFLKAGRRRRKLAVPVLLLRV